MKNKKTYKKNLRRIEIVVTAQTLDHLFHLCAIAGYSEKNVGKIIDKLVIAHCNQQRILKERTQEYEINRNNRFGRS